jgi:hypothetical protein
MKLKTWRVQRHPLTGQWNVPDCPKELLPAVAVILDWLEANPKHGITGYTSTSQLDKFLMAQWWLRKDHMKEAIEQGDVNQFCEWFMKHATFPDIIKRARLWLMKQELVEVPADIKRDAQMKYQLFQRSFGETR